MISIFEVNETNKMIEQENLDVRTITLGISLLDCIDSDLEKLNEKIYNKITTYAKDLVATGEKISAQYGIPIVNKRISVTPIGLVGGAVCVRPADPGASAFPTHPLCNTCNNFYMKKQYHFLHCFSCTLPTRY